MMGNDQVRFRGGGRPATASRYPASRPGPRVGFPPVPSAPARPVQVNLCVRGGSDRRVPGPAAVPRAGTAHGAGVVPASPRAVAVGSARVVGPSPQTKRLPNSTLHLTERTFRQADRAVPGLTASGG